jgi:thiamine pyrophosphate-dependent acetolactate synthase large subunit-like protein
MQTTVASALACQFRRLGIRRVFGLPGEDHLRLLDAIEAEGLQYVPAHDETAAAMMAAPKPMPADSPACCSSRMPPD